jgi:DNA repair exonuclease SbcCD nuclease subunit
MVKILATADWQMDMKGGRLNEAARATLAQARLDALDAIFVLAEAEKVDCILAAGDLFEYPSPSPEVIQSVARILQAHSEIPVHAIPGNHDLAGPGTVWDSPEIQANDHLTLHTEYQEVECNGFTLHPIPVKSKHELDPYDELLPDVNDRDGLNLVMAHAHDLDYMDLFSAHEDDCKLPIRSSKIIGKGYDYCVLGHWHSWNQVAERVLYPGTHEQTKFGERDSGYVAIIELDGDGMATTTQHRIGTIQWATEEFDCTGVDSESGLIEYLRSTKEGGVQFLSLRVFGEVDVKGRSEGLPRARAAGVPMFDHLEWNDDEVTLTVDVDSLKEEYKLPFGLAEIQESILEELNESDDSEARQYLLDELQALWRAARDTGIIGGEV